MISGLPPISRARRGRLPDLLLLFAGGPAWPLRCAAVAVVVAGIENVVVTALLPDWHANVPSAWHAMKRRRNDG
jgi:hypothetical protein